MTTVSEQEAYLAFRQNEADRGSSLTCSECHGPAEGEVTCEGEELCNACHQGFLGSAAPIINERLDWNTGRGYTPEGQRITSIIVAARGDERLHHYLVHMIDHDRGLDYLFELNGNTRWEVMHAYDHNQDVRSDEVLSRFGDPGKLTLDAIERRREVRYEGE